MSLAVGQEVADTGEKKKNLRVERENINGAPRYGGRGELQAQFVSVTNNSPTRCFASLLLLSQFSPVGLVGALYDLPDNATC